MRETLKKIVRFVIKEQNNLQEKISNAIDESGLAIDEYGWSIYKFEEMGPATYSIIIQRKDAHLPGRREVSIKNSVLRGLKNLLDGAWSRIGLSPESIDMKDVGNGMVRGIIVLPEKESYIKWEIP